MSDAQTIQKKGRIVQRTTRSPAVKTQTLSRAVPLNEAQRARTPRNFARGPTGAIGPATGP